MINVVVCCCADAVGVLAVSRRSCGCPVVRRRSTKVFLVASLFAFLTLSTLYTSPSYNIAYHDDDSNDRPPASSSIVLLSPLRASDTSQQYMSSALLARPDCSAIIAGDQVEIASTRRMLFRETRTMPLNTGGSLQAVNCTATFPHAAHVNASAPRLAYVISDAGSSVEQTELLLGAVYAAANIYCLTVDLCSTTDDHVATTLRRLTSCLSNVVVIEHRTRCTGSRDRKMNATTTTWWRCVDRLLRHSVDWSHLVSLSFADFPLRSRDDLACRLVAGKFDVARRTGNDVIQCGAYTRSAVSRSSTLRRARGKADESSTATSESDSPDGATALEVCAMKCATASVSDAKNVRCYYTIADLRSLVHERRLFAHSFNLNVDHYAVLCLMQQIFR